MMTRLFLVLGRFFFASFFLVSAWLTYKALDTVESAGLLGKEYAIKMAGPLNLLVFCSEEDKMNIPFFFISFFMGLKTIGGFLLLFDRREWVLPIRLYLLMATPLLCGFYHYNVGEPEFIILLQDFVQNMSFFGALLLLNRMKWKIWKISKKATEKKGVQELKRSKRIIGNSKRKRFRLEGGC